MDVSKIPRKRVSKKRKSAWRKHSQVAEVQQFLEQKIADERNANISNIKTDELFVTNEVSCKTKRSKDVVLRCHSMSLDALIKPIRGEPATARKVKPKRESRKKIKNSTDAEEEKKIELNKTKNFYDIWGSSSKSDEYDFDEHGKRVCKKIPVKPPASYGKKPNAVPAISLPLPGTSYHPDKKDYEDLLMKAYKVEVKKAKDQERIIRATDRMFPTLSEAPTEETWLKEMSEGLPMLETNACSDDNDDDDEEMKTEDSSEIRISNNPPVRRENKKTEKERRKMEENKMKEEQIKMEKVARIREAEKFRLKTMKKRMQQEEIKFAIRLAWRRYEAELKKDAPKKLGKARFKEPDLDLKLPEEMREGLRLLKPEGHILKDLVDSFQRRNLIPATVRGAIKRQKGAKTKIAEKRKFQNVKL